MPKSKTQLVEVARSFSYKHNLGNYQSADFFCSQKAEVPQKNSEKTSEALYQFCKQQVAKSLNEFLKTGIETPIAPSKKDGVDPEEKKEVATEMKMDDKAEDSPKYQSTIRGANGETNKVLIDKEKNTGEPI